MFQGQLVGIYVAAKKGEKLRECAEAEAIAGGGLAGDRYCRTPGKGNPDQEITLIESEALEAVHREAEITLPPCQARRNLVTRGVPLNHLVDKEFNIGQVKLRGIRLCEPCGHLEDLTQKGVRDALLHRGGLRAQIITGGKISVGDEVSVPNS